MRPEQWEEFLLDYKGPVDQRLAGYINETDQKVAELAGAAPRAIPEGSPYIAAEDNLENTRLATLNAELARLEGLLNADKLVRDQYSALSRRIRREAGALQTLQVRLADAKGAIERRRLLQQERNEAYERVFSAILSEEQALRELYAPIQQRLEAAGGTLRKLRFSISRSADADTWADYAEENLLDRRLEGPFRGRGALVEKAERELRPCWETGTAAEVMEAMSGFISTYQNAFLAGDYNRG